jgi:hypothetical protein
MMDRVVHVYERNSPLDVRGTTQLGMMRRATSADFPETSFSTFVVSRTWKLDGEFWAYCSRYISVIKRII